MLIFGVDGIWNIIAYVSLFVIAVKSQEAKVATLKRL